MECIQTTVEQEGFHGSLFPVDNEMEKVIITISGSDGGMTAAEAIAEFYQANGMAALAIGLFKTQQTGKYLDRVPLEYIERAISWLKVRGYKKIGVDAISKGTEYALTAAGKFHDISCVIVRTPSHFLSEGLGEKKNPTGTSCWSWHGKELPFTAYKQREFEMKARIMKEKEFNILPYNSGKDIKEESLISIEKIQAPILMFSTAADTVWPSVESCEYMMERLKNYNYTYPYEHISYKHISHFMLPMRRIWLLKLMFRSERIYTKECQENRADMNNRILKWVKEVWR